MHKLQLVFLAVALTSAAAANVEITLVGVNRTASGVNAVVAVLTHPGIFPKETTFKYGNISGIHFGEPRSHFLAVCGDKPNEGPTALVFTPEINKTSFFPRLEVDVRFSSHFHVLPAAQMDDLCKPKDDAASSFLLTVTNGWSPDPNAAGEEVPTHAMMFRKPGIYAVPEGFRTVVISKFSNNQQQQYTVYFCQYSSGKINPVSVVTADPGYISETNIKVSGIVAVDIVPKGKKACVLPFKVTA